MSGMGTGGPVNAWIVPAGSTSGAGALRTVERTLPALGHGKVQVAMRAWSLNFRDLGVASGRYLRA